MTLEMENTCNRCDCTVDTKCDEDAFWLHKVGRIRCPECGAVILPCNECAAETPYSERDCDNCPWKKAKFVN